MAKDLKMLFKGDLSALTHCGFIKLIVGVVVGKGSGLSDEENKQIGASVANWPLKSAML